MARSVVIITPDNVELSYELAGVGSRFIALFVDTVFQALLLAALAAVFWLAGVLGSLGDPLSNFTWPLAAAIVLAFLVFWGYFPFFETVWNGQTPGKRYAGIRVFRDQGFPLDFRAALIRNIVRLADMLPGVYGLGALFILFHPQCKRLGDLAAGTIVIRERQEEEPVKTTTPAHLPGARLTRTAIFAASSPLDLSLAPLQSLTREQLQAVKKYVDRRDSLDLATQDTLAAKIARPLLSTLGLTPEDIGGRFNDFLTQLVETYERQRATRLDL